MRSSDSTAAEAGGVGQPPLKRRLPIGAEVLPEGGVHFRVWAPASAQATVEFVSPQGRPGRSVRLTAEDGGYFSGVAPDAADGSLYRIALDSGAFPDPASRFQPEGLHGPSQVIDPRFSWSDKSWCGRPAQDWVMYELHLGTFTSEGTWAAAQARLPELARLGITVIELMPIAEFPGRFGWGYDGADLFAPTRLYGRPDDARSFVNHAHQLGLMVILDVVYNHIGPDGNYLKHFAADYFSADYSNEWGEALNFDGKNSMPVREFFASNARYWIEEFHFDGLRLDATQQIFDRSPTHVIAEIARVSREAGRGRLLCLAGENECQHARLVRPRAVGGYGLDVLWNDDFHHAAMVAATGRAEAYYSGYRGSAQEFISCVKRGFLYQGQWYEWQKARRGRPALDLVPLNFVVFLQNHDQIANSLRGQRIHQITSPGKFRALTALLLLGPNIPLLFQGQEFGASTPFLFFADLPPALAGLVQEGRRKFLQQFPTLACAETAAGLCDPGAVATFESCKLDFAENAQHRMMVRLHEDLLHLRRNDPTIRSPAGIDGAVLAEDAFVLRYFSPAADDRILIVNLGKDLRLVSAPEPLLAPVENGGWGLAWSSEAPDYGGGGTPALETRSGWMIPGQAALLMKPNENRELLPAKLSEKN